MEIKPGYVDGEPVCVETKCPAFGITVCTIDHMDAYTGAPCIPALRRDRDAAVAKAERAEAVSKQWEKECLATKDAMGKMQADITILRGQLARQKVK